MREQLAIGDWRLAIDYRLTIIYGLLRKRVENCKLLIANSLVIANWSLLIEAAGGRA
ncbi:MAG TPA: hypothetical protein VLG37_03685 [Candidatus Saccharimonadales bacterium]|nr:hypothetical protein [Candidatus Saccharimonadales bacterium]